MRTPRDSNEAIEMGGANRHRTGTSASGLRRKVSLDRPRVLVVDDDETFLDLMVPALERRGR